MSAGIKLHGDAIHLGPEDAAVAISHGERAELATGRGAPLFSNLRAALQDAKRRGLGPADVTATAIAPNAALAAEIKAFFAKFGVRLTIDLVLAEARHVRVDPSGRLQHRPVAAAAPKPARPIRVLIVDDSAPIRKIFRRMIEEAGPRFQVVGEAADPFEAERLRLSEKPDVMTLDLHMPGKDGVTYLREIKGQLPAVIVTDFRLEDSGPVMDALEAGAIDYMKKPGREEFADFQNDLCEKLAAAAGAARRVKRVRAAPRPARQPVSSRGRQSSLILIGASTGGTEAIKDVLTQLPADVPPVLIVQHMPPLFTASFAKRLSDVCAFPVLEAEDGMMITPGRALIAPGGRHMRINGHGDVLRVELTDDEPVNRFRPSVDYMFASATGVRVKRKLAVLLTGMGRDGARELLNLRASGALTIAQDEASSVVWGMPGAAVELDAAVEVLALDRIGERLTELLEE